MKTRKTFVSLMLVIAMVFSANIVPTISNAEETEQYRYAALIVSTPYKMYYMSPEDEYQKTAYSMLSSEDLKDDFGLDLPTDGSYGYTVLRALAQVIRNQIMLKDNIDDKTEANKKMKNYIKIHKDPSYGYYLDSLSPDGVNWDTGITKDGKDPTGIVNGAWMIYIDGKASDVGLDDTLPASNDYYPFIKIVWHPYDPGCGYAHFIQEKYGDWIALENKDAATTLKKDVYDESGNKTTVPVSGAAISVFDNQTGKFEDTKLTTDENGKVTLKRKAGYYTLVATEDTTVNGVTFSKIPMTTAAFYFVEKPVKAKSVKAKAAGKGKVKVTWKNGKKNADSLTKYYVYVSKKKSSGYKKVASGTGKKTKATVKKLKKGTYFVKILTKDMYNYDIQGGKKYKSFSGGYTKPVKVKVK